MQLETLSKMKSNKKCYSEERSGIVQKKKEWVSIGFTVNVQAVILQQRQGVLVLS